MKFFISYVPSTKKFSDESENMYRKNGEELQDSFIQKTWWFSKECFFPTYFIAGDGPSKHEIKTSHSEEVSDDYGEAGV